MIYEIEMKYVATITHTVEAEDEGEALDKARDWAEEADIEEFTIIDEMESRILSTR